MGAPLMSSSHVVALVMAAGYSRRFGQHDKRSAMLASGQSLLATSVAHAEYSFTLLRVAIREDDTPSLLGLADTMALIQLQTAHLGLGSSLAEAVAALSHDPRLDHVQAVAILLGDMPCIERKTLLALQRLATRDTILRPCYEGRPGHPVIFGREFWPALETLSGNSGAQPVIRRHLSQYREYDVQDDGTLIDIDAPEDIASLDSRRTEQAP